MSAFQICLFINYALCFFSIIGMIFVEHKKPIRVTAWSLVLIIFPFLGLLLYVLIGYGLGTKTKLLLKKRKLYNEKYNQDLQKQIQILNHIENNGLELGKYQDLVMLNLQNANSVFYQDNDVEFFNDGNVMLESLKQDLLSATKTINIMFYIFANDKTGKQIKDILVEKAKQGVKVKVLYDSIGSMHTHKRHFRKLKKAGGQIEEFFPAFLGLKLFNLRANYRNHRKIVVIDGKTAYMGGMNLRNDHMGQKKKVAPWRDLHIRVQGSACYSLQNIFISDWRLSNKIPEKNEHFLNNDYYAKHEFTGKTGMQIVSSGPTNHDNKNIEEMMIKMIMSAKKSIKIQTPYFVLDDEFKSALKLALLCGVKVDIIVPKKPDKRFVYYATLSHLKEIQEMGANVHLFHGFIHAKALMVDDEILTLGSCNIDIRSFALNFEVNAIIYGAENVKPFYDYFEADLKQSDKIGTQFFKKINLFKKLGMSISRLFSAIL